MPQFAAPVTGSLLIGHWPLVIGHFKKTPAAAPLGTAAGSSASLLMPLPSWFEQLRAVAHVIFQIERVLRFVVETRQVSLRSRAEQLHRSGAVICVHDDRLRALPSPAQFRLLVRVRTGAIRVIDDQRPHRIRRAVESGNVSPVVFPALENLAWRGDFVVRFWPGLGCRHREDALVRQIRGNQVSEGIVRCGDLLVVVVFPLGKRAVVVTRVDPQREADLARVGRGFCDARGHDGAGKCRRRDTREDGDDADDDEQLDERERRTEVCLFHERSIPHPCYRTVTARFAFRYLRTKASQTCPLTVSSLPLPSAPA